MATKWRMYYVLQDDTLMMSLSADCHPSSDTLFKVIQTKGP